MHIRTMALIAAAALVPAAPAVAQQSSSPSQSQQSGGQAQTVEQQDLQKYVQALQEMAQFEPGIQTALQQGQPVDPDVLDKVPREQAQEAIEKAGLSSAQFGYITEQLEQNQQAKQQFKQVAQQQSQQSGGSMSGSQSGGSQSQSGSQPQSSSSPSSQQK